MSYKIHKTAFAMTGMLNLRKPVALFTVLIFCLPVLGQEQLYDLEVNTKLRSAKLQEHSNLRNGRVLVDTLPFIDDFSSTEVYPDVNKWLDRDVYINNDLPFNPPTFGVASFDALDERGEPYVLGGPNSGAADTLTSVPLKLGQYTAADDVVMSFFVQAQGRGNLPEAADSFMLEFLDVNGVWNQVWGRTISQATTQSFQYIMIPIVQADYLFDGFQFRFRNYATLSGNNDHWHIDYVYIDENRSISNANLNDVAIVNATGSLLKKYHSMPLYQFIGFENQELRDTIFITANNLDNAIVNTDFFYDAFEDCNGTNFSSNFFQTINFPPLRDTTLFRTSFKQDVINLMPSINCDTLVISTAYQIDPKKPATRFNDSLVKRQVFANYFAYDDGTAEKAYGLAGTAINFQFAYAFELNKPDTLRGLQIHFAHVDRDMSNFLFSIMVWQNIDFANGLNDQVVYEQIFQKPVYVDTINGFYTYIFDDPVVLNGPFYIGWMQDTKENLRIGFDANNSAKEHTFFKVNGQWSQSSLDGAVMLRPVFGRELPVGITPVVQTATFDVYPNPATDHLRFNLPDGEYQYEVINVAGQVLDAGYLTDSSLSIKDFPSGIYVLRLKDQSNHFLHSKFLKK